jgi:hypothetical protein
MIFKNGKHPALGDCSVAAKQALQEQTPRFIAAERRRERERQAIEEAIRAERAAEEWARQQVQGTRQAMMVRNNCESLGTALWYAGALAESPSFIMDLVDGFDMLLANSTVRARADEEDDLYAADGDLFECYEELLSECQYDDVVGYVDDYCCPKAQRRAAHGAPRRFQTEKVCVAGEKMKAKAPVRARQQKQSSVAGARHSIAETRRLRNARRSQHKQHPSQLKSAQILCSE